MGKKKSSRIFLPNTVRKFGSFLRSRGELRFEAHGKMRFFSVKIAVDVGRSVFLASVVFVVSHFVLVRHPAVLTGEEKRKQGLVPPYIR